MTFAADIKDKIHPPPAPPPVAGQLSLVLFNCAGLHLPFPGRRNGPRLCDEWLVDLGLLR